MSVCVVASSERLWCGRYVCRASIILFGVPLPPAPPGPANEPVRSRSLPPALARGGFGRRPAPAGRGVYACVFTCFSPHSEVWISVFSPAHASRLSSTAFAVRERRYCLCVRRGFEVYVFCSFDHMSHPHPTHAPPHLHARTHGLTWCVAGARPCRPHPVP
jgi:hypothetical protein